MIADSSIFSLIAAIPGRTEAAVKRLILMVMITTSSHYRLGAPRTARRPPFRRTVARRAKRAIRVWGSVGRYLSPSRRCTADSIRAGHKQSAGDAGNRTRFVGLRVVARVGIEPTTRGFSVRRRARLGAGKPKSGKSFPRCRPNRFRTSRRAAALAARASPGYATTRHRSITPRPRTTRRTRLFRNVSIAGPTSEVMAARPVRLTRRHQRGWPRSCAAAPE